MKDLTDEHGAALLAAAEELAAEYAEITMTQTVAVEAAATTAKAAIDETAVRTKEALERYRAAAEAAHRRLVDRLASRTQDFLGLNAPAPEEPKFEQPTVYLHIPPLAEEFHDPETEHAAA